jgi:hypothetical protein
MRRRRKVENYRSNQTVKVLVVMRADARGGLMACRVSLSDPQNTAMSKRSRLRRAEDQGRGAEAEGQEDEMLSWC